MKNLRSLCLIISLFSTNYFFSQLDNLHYLPPLKQVDGSSTQDNQRSIDDQVIYLSTPETTSFNVDVYLGTSTTVLTSFAIVNGTPVEYTLPVGDNEITLVSNANTGVVLSNSGLRFESTGGENFYVNYRGRSLNQAGSLTSKGKSAFGTEFRWGGLPNNPVGDIDIIDNLSNSLGVMATEDNTLVTITGYDEDCVFREGTNASGITDDSITINLNKGQTFVLEALPSQAEANYSGWMGSSIISNNPIVISLGGLNVSVADQTSTDNAFRDVGIDQIVPVKRVGKEYAIVKARGEDAAEFAVAVAYQDNTEIYVGNTMIGEIDDGEFLIIDASNFQLPDPPIIIDGNVIDDGVGNMFISSDKSFYLYQCIAGQEGLATIGMNFVAPVSCFLPDNLDEIPLVNELPNYTDSVESAIVITAASSIPRSDIQIFQNGVALTQAELDVALFEGSDLINKDGDLAGWKTYGIQLVGNIKVEATGPIAVSLLVGFGEFGGLAGYFSGFGDVPDINVEITSSHCSPGTVIEVQNTDGIANYSNYKWFKDGVIVSDGTNNTYATTGLGEYYVEVTIDLCVFTSNTLTVIPCPTSIYFDGIDDYLRSNTNIITNANTLTTMAWLKLREAPLDKGYLLGVGNFNVYINSNQTIGVSVVTDVGSYSYSTSATVVLEKWTNITTVYDGSNTYTYINGSKVDEDLENISGVIDFNSTSFHIGKNPLLNSGFLNSNIQEVRIYDKALSAIQIQEQIYQKIEVSDNGVGIKGTITKHDIEDLDWDDLKLYLELERTVGNGFTPDMSSNTVFGSNTFELYNIEDNQDTSAPLPYVASLSGSWTESSTWEHGSVWDIETLPNKDWSIVKLTNSSSVTTTNSHTNLGLVIESGSKLEIENSQLLKNTRYLSLGGEIDLVGESQLIQTENSILEVLSTGGIEKDQDGRSSLYNYNYWSSPVGNFNSIENNKDFIIANVLKDGTDPSNPLKINFNTTGYNGAATSPITISDYWIFIFMNTPDEYNNWQQKRSTGLIKVGQGFTMKGTGTTQSSQNYVFNGKPNNGVIEHSIAANNLSLMGNPYPSAFDANKFINSNITSLTGVLYFWEHWGGESHVLKEYEGGYATLSLAGGVKAVSDPNVSQNGEGTITPGRYIPVGQGFFVKGSAIGGSVKFENPQRVFKRESIITDNSTFFKEGTENQNDSTSEIQRVYFEFTSPNGTVRQLLLGIKEGLTEGIDVGYDGEVIGDYSSDCLWRLTNTLSNNSQNLVIQSIGEIYEDLILPLEITLDLAGQSKFEVTFSDIMHHDLEMFLFDYELNMYSKLELNSPIELDLEPGVYDSRFYITFKNDNILTNSEDLTKDDSLNAFYDKENKNIVISNDSNSSISKIALHEISGKNILRLIDNYENTKQIKIPVNISLGLYILSIENENKTSFRKKILIY